MKNNDLAQKVKTLRNRKGYSQEELSDKTGLSLRTIQRIENGETEPRGDSLKRLAMIFEVSPDEIVDWTVQENKGFLVGMNLSALSFIVFPILGILIPLIIWIQKKDKIRQLNELAKKLLKYLYPYINQPLTTFSNKKLTIIRYDFQTVRKRKNTPQRYKKTNSKPHFPLVLFLKTQKNSNTTHTETSQQ